MSKSSKRKNSKRTISQELHLQHSILLMIRKKINDKLVTKFISHTILKIVKPNINDAGLRGWWCRSSPCVYCSISNDRIEINGPKYKLVYVLVANPNFDEMVSQKVNEYLLDLHYAQ